MGLIGFMIYCAGLVVGIVVASCIDDMFTNIRRFKDGSNRAGKF
jgi:hypothetical protein